MASKICSSGFDAGMTFANRTLRSLSQLSQPSSPIESPGSPSTPLIPATPTNTPSTNLNSPTAGAVSPVCLASANSPASPSTSVGSPLTLTVPTNTPASNLDSGLVSPEGGVGLGAHPPVFLEAHHFESPLLSPSVPPNSPESWPFQESIKGNMATELHEEIHASLSDRLAGLTLASHKPDGFTKDDVEKLGSAIPKSPDNGFYEIRVVPEKGFGCFAINPIKRGTRILADSPLLIVPIAEYFQTDIQAAFDKLTHAEQAFYFTLHSAHGQDPANWPRRIHDSVVGRERQRIEEQHKARVGKEPSLISIFQTNCMEKDGGAAVFPNAARFNHSCNPNACFTWNPAIQKETVHAIKDIPAGDQITLAYCDTTHDKATRQWELKHYGFLCDCHACSGDESDSSSWAAKSAARRYRMMELQQETRYKRGKFLEFGVKTEAFVGKLLEFAKLMNEEGDYTARAADIYLDIALVCEQHGDLNFARLAAQKALQIIMDCAGPDFPDAKKYAGVVKRIKGKIEMKSQADREVEKR